MVFLLTVGERSSPTVNQTSQSAQICEQVFFLLLLKRHLFELQLTVQVFKICGFFISSFSTGHFWMLNTPTVEAKWLLCAGKREKTGEYKNRFMCYYWMRSAEKNCLQTHSPLLSSIILFGGCKLLHYQHHSVLIIPTAWVNAG